MARAVAHGAVTIVNAMATYRGAALSVNLEARATATTLQTPGAIRAKTLNPRCRGTSLIEAACETVLEHLKAQKTHGLRAEVDSQIPVAKGLKSSSAVANAVVLASAKALGRPLTLRRALRLSVEAAKRAGVTVTGAFDDASASMLGGLTVTDNKSLRLLKRLRVKEGLNAVILVPPGQSFSGKIEAERLRPVARVLSLAHSLAMRGEPWLAMTVNGLACSAVFGYSPQPALDAIRAGALAASLSGKGPAVGAIVDEGLVEKVKEALSAYEGEVLVAGVNNRHARVE